LAEHGKEGFNAAWAGHKGFVRPEEFQEQEKNHRNAA
jgi:hypothetical protein